jgi:PQQ-dependent dehydrogenase (s-GDH family)
MLANAGSAGRHDAAVRDARRDDPPDHEIDAAPPRDAAADSAMDAAMGGDPAVDAAPADAGMDAAMSDASIQDGGHEDAAPQDTGVRDAAPDTEPPDENDAGPHDDEFAMRIVTQGLGAPWEITWGPDGRLWITERTGKRVIRIDPATGTRKTALSVTDAYQASGQDGVLGMALHPRLLQGAGSDYVYLAYTYDADPGATLDRRAKIVRYQYDAGTETLGSPVVVLAGLSASEDHNSGRLVFGPDNQLYYTIGDQGHNQFQNACLPNHAQDLPTQAQVNAADWSLYQGKILRIALDGSIPSDNPLIAGVRSHVYSYGHRNVQGLVFGPDGKLYAAEQGPKTDDELNLIAPGKNYGWPNVAGFRDDRAYVYGNWSASSPTACNTLEYSDYEIPASVPVQRESTWSQPDFVPPFQTYYTVDTGYDFMNPDCADNPFICWPTIAPSSADLYDPGPYGLQSWGRALLLTSLKAGSVFRVQLGADGQSTVGKALPVFKTTNRYRDLAIAPDHRTFYVITDSDGSTSGPTRGSTQQLDNLGAVLEFRAR